jgi:hypothetical protein
LWPREAEKHWLKSTLQFQSFPKRIYSLHIERSSTVHIGIV